MDLLMMFIAGFLSGITILGYWALRREEKNHDRDNQNTQSNQEGAAGIYPVSSEEGAESSVPGSSDNGESLDKAAEEAIHSRDYIAQYCGGQCGCRKCCFGDKNGGCSLISGPPCMWAKRGGEENV